MESACIWKKNKKGRKKRMNDLMTIDDVIQDDLDYMRAIAQCRTMPETELKKINIPWLGDLKTLLDEQDKLLNEKEGRFSI